MTSPTPTPLLETAATETLTTLPELEALRPEWTALWRECSSATPFQSPEWLIPWARHWAADSLHVLAVRQEGTLIGLAPFFIYADGDPTTPSGLPNRLAEDSPGPDEVVGSPTRTVVRTVVLLGNGVSDTLDILAAPGCEAMVAASVISTLEQQSDRWDTCDWQQLRPGSPLLEHPAPVSWADTIEPQDAWLTLTLPASGQAIETVLSTHFARRLAADRLRMARLGAVTFERATTETLDACLESLIRLHAARWSARNRQPGMLADPTMQAFHREAAAGLLARGVLRFYRLLIGGRVVAVYHGFQHRERASYYLGGFDPALGSLGVGNQLVWHALRRAQEEDARVFDFLRGREPYKYRWGAVDMPAFRRRLARPDTSP